jgi:hypothetical protein
MNEQSATRPALGNVLSALLILRMGMPALDKPEAKLLLTPNSKAWLLLWSSEHLNALVQQLLEQHDQPDFPAACLKTVRQSIAPLREEHAIRNTILLPQQDAVGKSLNCILLLAAACAVEGLGALTRHRKQSDEQRRFGTRNWVSWVRGARKSSPYLSSIHASRWSRVSAYCASPANTEDTALSDLDDTIVACFTNHEVESLSNLDGFDES